MGRLRLPLALFALTLLSRIPFATHDLWAWDSVLYARSLERGFQVSFLLAEQRPQPPGYILYVAAAALARLVLADSNAALVTISALASALSVAAVYLLARRFCGTGCALFVAAGFALNPLVWVYGEVAYPYAVLGLLSVALAALFHRARGAGRATLVASLAFGVASGFRQDLLLLLGPLWLWMVWPSSHRERAAAAGLVLAGIALWLVPTAALSGGLGGYLTALTRQTGAVSSLYSVPAHGIAALSYNVRFTFYALAWGLLGFGVILAGLAIATVRHGLRARGTLHFDGPRAFFAFWVVPGLLFYTTVHIGEWGYVLSVLPGLYVVTAGLLARPLAALRARPAALRAIALAIAAAPGLVFLASDARFSAASLARHDRSVDARVAWVRATFPADRTIILAREDYLTARYYLPEYRVWYYDPEPGRVAARRRRTMSASALVVFTEGLMPRQGLDLRLTEVSPGLTIAHVEIRPGDELELYEDGVHVREPQ